MDDRWHEWMKSSDSLSAESRQGTCKTNLCMLTCSILLLAVCIFYGSIMIDVLVVIILVLSPRNSLESLNKSLRSSMYLRWTCNRGLRQVLGCMVMLSADRTTYRAESSEKKMLRAVRLERRGLRCYEGRFFITVSPGWVSAGTPGG